MLWKAPVGLIYNIHCSVSSVQSWAPTYLRWSGWWWCDCSWSTFILAGVSHVYCKYMGDHWVGSSLSSPLLCSGVSVVQSVDKVEKWEVTSWRVSILIRLVGQTSPDWVWLAGGGRLSVAQLVPASDVVWGDQLAPVPPPQTQSITRPQILSPLSLTCPGGQQDCVDCSGVCVESVVFRTVAPPLYQARLCSALTRYCWGDSPLSALPPPPPGGRHWRAGQRNDRKLEDVVIRLVSSAAPSCPSHHTPSLSSLDFVCIV